MDKEEATAIAKTVQGEEGSAEAPKAEGTEAGGTEAEKKEEGAAAGLNESDDRVKRAVAFLQNPRLASMTLEQKILFLAQKQKMNREEISLAIAQLQPSEEEVNASMEKVAKEREEKEAAAKSQEEGAAESKEGASFEELRTIVRI